MLIRKQQVFSKRLAELTQMPSTDHFGDECEATTYWGALCMVEATILMHHIDTSLYLTRSGTSSKWRSTCISCDWPRPNFLVSLTRRVVQPNAKETKETKDSSSRWALMHWNLMACRNNNNNNNNNNTCMCKNRGGSSVLSWQSSKTIISCMHGCTLTFWNKTAELSQRWPRDAPYVWDGYPENFRESLTTPMATFPKKI